MKKTAFALLILLLSAKSIIAQTPVAYYPFNGNANDAIGSLNGTVNGATLTTDRFGNANSAYSFDGVDDFIGLNGSFNTYTQVTISAWYKITANSPNIQAIVSSDNTAKFVHMQVNTATAQDNAVYYDGVNAILLNRPTAVLNQWKQVVITAKSGDTRIYENGVLISSSNVIFSFITNADLLRIGSGFLNARFFNGAIDEVKIYNTALTAAQVQNEFASNNQAQKPGSGNALSFDGMNDFIQVPHRSNIDFGLNDNFSIDFWLKIPSGNQPNTNGEHNVIFEKGNVPGNCSYQIRYENQTSASTGRIGFLRNNGGTEVFVFNTLPQNDDKFHHITCVKDGPTLLFYVDGILNNTKPDLTSGSTNSNSDLYIGSRSGSSIFLKSDLDEVRIWNTALTQTQIRDRICRKITPTDALYSNLVAYYNFDESTGNTAFDGTANANNGTLTNAPTRVTSGAAIGNASAHDYVNATKTTSIVHPTGESFTVTSSTGNPDGIQVYRIDEKPTVLTGTQGVGNNNKYFGVFQANGTSPQYTAVYNYAGNPGVTSESVLRLFKRSDNSSATWSAISTLPDEPSNTITVTGESTEYILGTIGTPLPLNLISFTASKQNADALLQWKTTNEINVSKFELQRSEDGQSFNTIATILAGNSNYAYADVSAFAGKPVLFYRLKSIDIDGRFTYSAIIRLVSKPTGLLTIFPNPATDVLTIGGLKGDGEIRITSMDGKVLTRQPVAAQTMTMDISQFAKGIYMVQYQVNGEVINQKIIKQ